MLESYGPFNFNDKSNTITLVPGIYVINEPIVFGAHEDTKIEGVVYKPLEGAEMNMIADQARQS